MRGVTMHVGTLVTVVVILGLSTILEATYLERPLWVADKGRPLSSGSIPQEQSRAGQVQAGNEQSWLIPEPYGYPSRNGADASESRVESPQWSWDQFAVEQNVREERPVVENFQPNRPYDYQGMHYGQGAMGGAVQPSNEPGKQVQLPKPSEPQVKPEFEYSSFNGQQGWDMQPKPDIDAWKPSQMKPELEYSSFNGQQGWDSQPKPEIDVWKPSQVKPSQAKPSQMKPEFEYSSFNGQQGWDTQPKPEIDAWKPSQVKPSQARPSQVKPEFEYPSFNGQQGWDSQPKPEIDAWKPSQVRPSQVKPEFEYPSFNGQQGWNTQPKPDVSQPNPYQPQSGQAGQEEYQPYQKKPEPQPEPTLPKEQEKQQTYGSPQTGYDTSYQSQQANNAPRPDMYRPEPDYQMPYYGQQPSEYMPDMDYQMPPSRKPAVELVKPQLDINRVRKPKPELAQPAPNTGYYPYQQQEWSPYQTPAERLQASLQGTEQETRGRENLPANPNYLQQQAYENSASLNRAPQANRPQPPQPPKVAQRPYRPVEREPEREPIRVPSTPWDMQQFKPVQPAPQPAPQPKPQPKPQVQRPPQVVPEPTYNRRPVETYYEDNGDNEKYEKAITRFDTRCPREDDPAKPVHFPSATSCVKFQKCFNGIAYEMSCPPGLEFDAMNNRCDYPAKARCSK